MDYNLGQFRRIVSVDVIATYCWWYPCDGLQSF